MPPERFCNADRLCRLNVFDIATLACALTLLTSYCRFLEVHTLTGSYKMAAVPTISLAILLACTGHAARATSTRDYRYIKELSMTNRVSTAGVVFESEARSKVDCVRQCGERERCRSLTFVQGPTPTSPGSCRGSSLELLSQSGQWSNARGARTFRKVGTGK